MRSAARSVSPERGLASARLPIGVATTYRVPVNQRVSSFVKRAMNREGARAEDLFAELLRAAGLKLVERNWRCRQGEIDLIAEELVHMEYAVVRILGPCGVCGASAAVSVS